MVKMPSATRAGRSWDRMLLSPLPIGVLSITLVPGPRGVLPGPGGAHSDFSPLWPGLTSVFVGLLTLVFLLEVHPTIAPQPTHEDAIHEYHNQELRDLVSTWGERSLGFQSQQPSYQEEWYPDVPPSWTL